MRSYLTATHPMSKRAWNCSMANIKLGWLLFLLFAIRVSAAEMVDIEINNHLQKCMILNNKGMAYFNDVPVLNFGVKSISDSAACGCKSVSSQYRVYNMIAGHESLIMAGDFSLLGRAELQLPIAAQKQMISGAQKIKIIVGCSNPL